MNKLISRSFCIAAIFCACGGDLLAEVDSLVCTKEELMLFFPPAIVKHVLVDAHYPEKQADEISKDLMGNDQKLRKLVEDKAEKQNPNPFKNLSQRDEAIKIYQETLFEIFAGVLKAHGVNDEHEIHTLLDEIRSTKSKMFIECIQKAELVK